MVRQNHVGDFLRFIPLKIHESNYRNNQYIYLSVVNASNCLAGYIIISIEKHAEQVQLKRVLIDEKNLGIGRAAIILAEQYCVHTLKTQSIWLDVYQDNVKAIQVYEKLGYKKYKEGIENNRSVVFFEKNL